MPKIYTLTLNGEEYWNRYIEPIDGWWDMEDDDFEVTKTYGISPSDLQALNGFYAPTTVKNMEALLRMYNDGYASDCWEETLVREFCPADPSSIYKTTRGKVSGNEADMTSRLSYFIDNICRCCRCNEYGDGSEYHLVRVLDEQFGKDDIFIAYWMSCWNIIPDNFGSEFARGWGAGCPSFEWS